MYYIYMISCEDSTIYTGITTDPQRRLAEHGGYGGRGAKYTRSHKPEKLLALWSCDDRSAALKLEYRIKQLKRPQKEKLAENGELEMLAGGLDIGSYEKIAL